VVLQRSHLVQIPLGTDFFGSAARPCVRDHQAMAR
jgi:hypothetical protein